MSYQRKKYDQCFINRISKGKQCIVIWNVDDLKMLHVDSDIPPSVLSDIDAEFGKIAKMTILRGKIQKYLGMTIDYSCPGKVIFYMVYCIGKMINKTPE